MNSYRVASQSLILLPRSVRNRAYLAFLRGQPCTVCGQNWSIDPAHTGPRGRGQRATDLHAIPLCRRHHDEYHRGPADFLDRHGVDLLNTIAVLHRRATACRVDLERDDRAKKRPGRAGGLKSRRWGVA